MIAEDSLDATRISLVEVRYAHFEHKEEQFATNSDQNFRRGARRRGRVAEGGGLLNLPAPRSIRMRGKCDGGPGRDVYTVQRPMRWLTRTDVMWGPRFSSTVPRQELPAPHFIRFPVGRRRASCLHLIGRLSNRLRVAACLQVLATVANEWDRLPRITVSGMGSIGTLNSRSAKLELLQA